MSDPAIVLDLIDAFRRSQTMFAAVELGVFEGKREGAEIERLLEACGSLGLLERNAEGKWVNTPVADEYLRKSSPRSMLGYIQYSHAALYPMWGHLDDAVRHGGSRWNQTFGYEGGIFSSFFKTDEARDTFLMGMHGFGQISSPAVVRAFDLSGFRKFVDLGGATGHLALAAVAQWPNLEAAVFDLPVAVEFAHRFLDGTPVGLIAGDFFVDALPPGDLYALGRILHDWSQPKIELLLSRIFAALPSGGGLLIAEKLLRPDYVSGHMQSLNMLVCTEGRERTLDEYRTLLEQAGFTAIEGVVTGKPIDAVLARKP